MTAAYSDIVEAFCRTGLCVRGGFEADGGELPPAASGAPARALVLVGNVGTDLWAAFERGRRDEPHPLDAWTCRTVDPIAARLGAVAVYPSARPWHPFQRWAMRGEPVSQSPIGLLIHPVYGLWHAYRAALLFDHALSDLPVRERQPSPCEACADRPCLTACPVGAHSERGFDLKACAGHLETAARPCCIEVGCRSRDACPIGRAYRFSAEQVAFHMRAFHRARANQR